MRTHSLTQIRHRGFTLLELLIVVSLMAVLMSLSAVVYFGVSDAANEEATAATLRKLNGMLERRIEGFNKAFGRNGSFRDRYVDAARNLLIQDRIFGPLANNRVTGEPDSAVVEALARKVAMRHLFPQRHEDLLLVNFLADGTTSVSDFDGVTLKAIPGDPMNIDLQTERSIDINGNRISDRVEEAASDRALLLSTHPAGGDNGSVFQNDETVSAELLYFFLVNSTALGASDAVSDQFLESEIADTDNDGLLEFVDAWGNPLRFYRWPTRMIDVDPPPTFQPVLSNLSDPTDIGVRGITEQERLVANVMIKGLPPAPTSLPNGALPRDLLLIDQDDPVGVLYRGLEQYNGTAGNGEPLSTEFNEANYHTPDTYHTPLIVSAGLDEELGLFEPSDTANLGNLAAYDPANLEAILDNLTSRNRRSGGR